MVTRIVVLRITPPAERVSAAEDSNRDDINQLQNKEQDDDDKEEDQSFRGCLSIKAVDGGFCDGHSSQDDVSSHCKPNDDTIDEGKAAVDDICRQDTTSKKRPLLLEDDADDDGKKEYRKKRQMFIDLTDVPPQSPILRRDGRIKEGASKYQGVTFRTTNNKWVAQIMIGQVQYHLGSYDNEEEAAIDYARAKFKYDADNAEGERKQEFLDLTDVPPRPPILKSKRREGTSKYQGVTFKKSKSKWVANIMIDKVQHYLGSYDDEEEAAIDYARAVFKYKSAIIPNGRPSVHTKVQRCWNTPK